MASGGWSKQSQLQEAPLLCGHLAHISGASGEATQPLRDLQKPGVSRYKGRRAVGEACSTQGAGTVSSWAAFHAIWANAVFSEKGSASGGWTGHRSTLGLEELSVDMILPWEGLRVFQNLGRWRGAALAGAT